MGQKRAYVVMEPVGKSPRLAGYDSYVTIWECFKGMIEVWAEELELGVPATITMTVHEWTEEEYHVYCEEKAIEIN